MKRRLAACPRAVLSGICLLLWMIVAIGIEAPSPLRAQAPEAQAPEKERPAPKEKLITLDFNNVDLPVFVKFVSELTGRNFVIDERVRGKVTIFSPSKVAVDHVYELFLSVLELKGFSVVQSGPVYQIVPVAEIPTEPPS